MISSGHPYAVFRRAIDGGNLLVAEATVRELRTLSLGDALELTILIGRKDPRRYTRAAARWLSLYLQQADGPTLEDATLIAGCLTALNGRQHEGAAATLRTMAGSLK
jgi:hypothetical protein